MEEKPEKIQLAQQIAVLLDKVNNTSLKKHHNCISSERHRADPCTGHLSWVRTHQHRRPGNGNKCTFSSIHAHHRIVLLQENEPRTFVSS